VLFHIRIAVVVLLQVTPTMRQMASLAERFA
jgi:hypothetical protein